jgi:hypothetical protein
MVLGFLLALFDFNDMTFEPILKQPIWPFKTAF